MFYVLCLNGSLFNHFDSDYTMDSIMQNLFLNKINETKMRKSLTSYHIY